MTLWHPHTEQPTEAATVAVIAIPSSDPDNAPHLVEGLYRWQADRWVSESSKPHRTVLDEPVFWWCNEQDLLDALIAEHDIEVTPS